MTVPGKEGTLCIRARMSHSRATLEERHSGRMELPMPEPRSRRAEEAAGEKCGAKEFGYFSKCKDKGRKQKSDYDRTFILKLQFWQPYRQRSIRGWEKGTSREEGPVGYFTR